MTTSDVIARVDRLKVALQKLTDQQLRFIESLVVQFQRPFVKIN
jgi:hypothetical protein